MVFGSKVRRHSHSNGLYHIILNSLAVIAKIYDNSGLEDLLIDSGVYACGKASQLPKGKQYNRDIRAHKLVSETIFPFTVK